MNNIILMRICASASFIFYLKNKQKETALEMIHRIREAFNELLADIHWMDDETRAVAKEKADAMNERIGYPEILTDDEELEKEYANVRIQKFVVQLKLN